MKKRLLFAVDIKDWAYHNIAKSYGDYLSHYDLYYYITKDYAIREKKFNFFQFLYINTLNVIRFFVFKAFGKQSKVYFVDKTLKFSYPVYIHDKVYSLKTNEIANPKKVDYLWEMAYYFQYISVLPKIKFSKKFVGIYTDSFPHEGPSHDIRKNADVSSLNLQHFYSEYLHHYHGVIVGSKNLLELYLPIAKNIVFSSNILGQNLFQENNHVGENEDLCIAWTGNPAREMKNFYTIIEPTIDFLKKKGLRIRLKTKFSGSYEELYTFYTDVDLIIIASDADTGPSMFAEASLSNVPAVSTYIGFPKMVVQNNVNGVVVENNTIKDFAEAIETLYHHRELLKKFSNRIKQDYLAELENQKMANDLIKFIEA